MSPQRKSRPASIPSPAPHHLETNAYPWVPAMQSQPYIKVTVHDVLSGRGVNIAQHAGNERFRALVCARHDVNYCHSYTTAEKRAIAEEIVAHILSLDPPGRFLRRAGRPNRTIRGLDGPWEELTSDEAIKKTCQALRDSNRLDRTGYAAAVFVPEDVSSSQQIRSRSGLTNKQLAEIAAAQAKLGLDVKVQKPAAATVATVTSNQIQKREHDVAMLNPAHLHQTEFSSHPEDYEPTPISETTADSNRLSWVKKQRFTGNSGVGSTPMPHGTPTTAGSSSGFSSLPEESGGGISIDHHNQHHHHLMVNVYSPVATAAMTALLASHDQSSKNENILSAPPVVLSSLPTSDHDHDFDDCHDDFSSHFDEDDDISNLVHDDIHKHLADSSNDDNIVVPLDVTADAAVTAAMEAANRTSAGRNDDSESHRDLDFGPPSPLHLEHHHGDDPF
jgi:hypothetical protein